MADGNTPANSNIVFLSSELCGRDDCLQQTIENPAEENILIISYTETVEELLSTLSDNLDNLPANLGFISAGEQLRSVGHSAKPVEMMDGVTVSTIGQDDLTGLDISVTEHFSMWEGNGNKTKLCFYSLTPLGMVEADLERLYRFLHVLTRKVAYADAVGYYHINPKAHSEEVRAKLKPLFDAVETGQ